MNILFCGDSGICEGLRLSALSLCENTARALRFYILTATVGERVAIPREFADGLQRALRKTNPETRVLLLDISREFERELPLANMNTRFTPLCMLRLFADRVPEIPDRILYLDTDVLCRGDIAPLYDTDLKGAELAGVPDRYGKWFFGNIFKHDYLNSGVLLLDMAAIRQSGLFERCRRLCREKKMFMPDQTALNKLAVKTKLPAKFNAQGAIKKDTVLKHFTTFFRFFPYFHSVTVKPWQTEELHKTLKIFEFDDIIQRSQQHDQ